MSDSPFERRFTAAVYISALLKFVAVKPPWKGICPAGWVVRVCGVRVCAIKTCIIIYNIYIYYTQCTCLHRTRTRICVHEYSRLLCAH